MDIIYGYLNNLLCKGIIEEIGTIKDVLRCELFCVHDGQEILSKESTIFCKGRADEEIVVSCFWDVERTLLAGGIRDNMVSL